MSEVDLKELEAVLKLVQKYQLDTLELPNGTKITKKMHLGKAPLPPKLGHPPPINFSDEDLMFAASTAPKLSLEDFNKFAANPIKDK